MTNQTIQEFCKMHGTDLDAISKLLEKIDKDKDDALENIFFSAISILNKNKLKAILELGTGYGSRTSLLAKLFPKSKIYTWDLPKTDPEFGRLNIKTNEERINIFNKTIYNKQVRYIENNSFFLRSTNMPKKYDFVYMDGAHQYPACAWDLAFCYNCLKDGGFLFIHDYGAGDVSRAVDYADKLILEEIYLLNQYKDTKPNIKMAWLQKGKNKQ